MDIRTWSREVITDLLNLYKSFPCLWKIKSESYKNKNIRDRAYQRLVQFFKDRGIPTANRDFVVKKIQSLRGSFRKELKKVEDSRRSGRSGDEVYEPSLWYYDLLLFTKDQELPTDSLSTDSSDVQELLEDLNHEQQVVSEESRGTDKVTSGTRRRGISRVKSPQKKKKKSGDSVQAEFLAVGTESLKSNSKPLTEYDAFAINVAKKIEKMDEIQAIYAESLISSVLRDGLLKKLKAESDICKGSCKITIQTTNTPSESVDGRRSPRLVGSRATLSSTSSNQLNEDEAEYLDEQYLDL